MYKIATIHVSGTRAVAVDVNTITKGIKGAVVELFYDDPLWDGLIKNVVFEGSETVAVENAGSVVTFPDQVAMAKSVPITVGVEGLSADGAVIIPTIKVDLGVVRNSAHGSFPPPQEQALPVWAQIQTKVKSLEDRVEDLEENPGGNGGNVDLSGYVKSVNGKRPDAAGNVQIEIPDSGQTGNQGGFSRALRVAIYNLLMDAAYQSSGHEADKTALAELLTGGSVTPDVPDVPDEPVTTYYTVEKTLANVSISNGAATVAAGAAYSATLTADAGYVLGEVAVTMGGVAVPVTDGVINIASVTGNIVIVATAEAEAVGGYEWESGVPYDMTDKVFSGVQLVTGTGKESANANYVTTDYLNCFDAASIKYDDTISTVFFYDVNKGFISSAYSRVNPAIVAVPDGAVYVRLTCVSAYWKTAKVVPIARTAETYTLGVQDVAWETGRLDVNTGAVITASGAVSDYICVNGAKCLHSPGNLSFGVVCLYDANKTFIGGATSVMEPIDLIAKYPGISYIRLFVGATSRDIYVDNSIVYTVTRTLKNVNYAHATDACSGEQYTNTLTAASGYTLDGGTVSITMGGVDVTTTAYNATDGTITIENVTGNIVITATAVAE